MVMCSVSYNCRRQLKRPAHLISAGIFFIADQARPIELRGNLLVIIIFGFLQFPPVSHERALAVPVIYEIDFRARHRERDRFCRRKKLTRFLPLFIALTASPAVATATSAGVPTAHAAASATVAAIRP